MHYGIKQQYILLKPMTLRNFLAELSFIQIAGIKRHAKGLLIALEKSNRKEMLDYEVKFKERKIYCNECYKELTEEELKEYPIQWQYSGDMYCKKHKIRP